MKDTKKRLSKRHIFLLLLCLCVSVLYGFPHLLWLHENNWDYQNTIFITSFKSYDANLYLSQIKDVYDGNYRMSNVYIAEYKDAARPLWPVFPIYLVTFVGKSLHLKVQHLAVLMDFFLPPLIFLLLYTLLALVSRTRRESALGAFLLVTLPHLTRLSDFQRLGHAGLEMLTSRNFAELVPALWHVHAYHDGFARQINPQLTICFLLAALIFFLRTLTDSRKRDLALTIFFGILTSYSYVYFSSFLYVFWCVFILLSVPFKQSSYIKPGVMALSGTLIGATPFWLSAFGFSDPELLQSTLMIRTHAPIFTSQVLFMLVLCAVLTLLLKFGKMRHFPGLFALTILLAAVAVLNHRILSGIEIQSWHYEIHILPQMTLLALILISIELGRRRFSFLRTRSLSAPFLLGFIGAICLLISLFAAPELLARYFSSDGILSPQAKVFLRIFRLLTGIIGSVTLISLVFPFRNTLKKCSVSVGSLLYLLAFIPALMSVAAVQYSLYYGFLRPHLGYNQQLAPALTWLDRHTEKESVVLCGINYHTPNVVVPIYTHNNVYFAPLMGLYPVTPHSEVRDRMYNVMAFMGLTERQDFEQYASNEHLGATFEEYQQKLEKDLYDELTTYQADYLFYGPRERVSFRTDPENYWFLRSVYKDPEVTIYQIQ